MFQMFHVKHLRNLPSSKTFRASPRAVPYQPVAKLLPAKPQRRKVRQRWERTFRLLSLLTTQPMWA